MYIKINKFNSYVRASLTFFKDIIYLTYFEFILFVDIF